MNEPTIPRKWLSIGNALVEAIGKPNIEAAIAELQFSDEKRLPFSQGYAINEMTKQFRLNARQTAYGSVSNGDNTYALLAVEAVYVNGVAKIYVLDDGMTLTPIVSDYDPSAK